MEGDNEAVDAIYDILRKRCNSMDARRHLVMGAVLLDLQEAGLCGLLCGNSSNLIDRVQEKIEENENRFNLLRTIYELGIFKSVVYNARNPPKELPRAIY